MNKDSGLQLLEAIREQKRYFTKTLDGKIIKYWNRPMYEALERKIFDIQKLIGRENKRNFTEKEKLYSKNNKEV